MSGRCGHSHRPRGYAAGMTGGGTIVTIDGPAGTGKSSVARAVAKALGFDFLDTGAMYRAVGLAAHRREADLEDARELAYVAEHCRIDFDWDRDPPALILNGEDVGHLLRGGEATRAASFVAVVPAIRDRLVEQQRQIGREHAARAGLGSPRGGTRAASSSPTPRRRSS